MNYFCPPNFYHRLWPSKLSIPLYRSKSGKSFWVSAYSNIGAWKHAPLVCLSLRHSKTPCPSVDPLSKIFLVTPMNWATVWCRNWKNRSFQWRHQCHSVTVYSDLDWVCTMVYTSSYMKDVSLTLQYQCTSHNGVDTKSKFNWLIQLLLIKSPSYKKSTDIYCHDYL